MGFMSEWQYSMIGYKNGAYKFSNMGSRFDKAY